jgi:hypothetical protein
MNKLGCKKRRGPMILKELASSCASPKTRAVALLLLPHFPELFLLQLGLVQK